MYTYIHTISSPPPLHHRPPVRSSAPWALYSTYHHIRTCLTVHTCACMSAPTPTLAPTATVIKKNNLGRPETQKNETETEIIQKQLSSSTRQTRPNKNRAKNADKKVNQSGIEYNTASATTTGGYLV